jgi:hypothetical protein
MSINSGDMIIYDEATTKKESGNYVFPSKIAYAMKNINVIENISVVRDGIIVIGNADVMKNRHAKKNVVY